LNGDPFYNGDLAGDTLTGGAGHDVFVFNAQLIGKDVITDFTQGQDLIDLSTMSARLGILDNFDAWMAENVSSSVGGTSIDLGVQDPFLLGIIKLVGINPEDLTEADFIL
jgi:Ca2+-binding RTX toxin-like protein